MRTAAIRIRTPEGVQFDLPLAGPVSRFLAWLVDGATIMALGSVAGSVLGMLGLLSLDLAMALSMWVWFALSVAYGVLTEWLWRGQTLGKRLLGLRVMDDRGLRLHVPQILVRNLLRPVDLLPGFYLVGGAAMLCGPRAQRLGDLAAGTVVVRAGRAPAPDFEQILAGKFNSLRAHPHLEARLRQRVTPDQAGVALQALLRRDALEPAARVELFAALAAAFRDLVPFPAETTEGLADEQYVRNVVDIVFRPRAPAAAPPAAQRAAS